MGVECPKCKTENTSDSEFCKKCATPLPSSKEIPVTVTIETPKEELTRGTTLAGRYEIIEELGRGGMGNVYRVEDKKTNEELALKLIKPEIASDKKTLERFSNELKLAHKISHKNVCRMYHLGEEEGVHFITMEYVPGEDLKSMIRMTRQLTVGTAISMAKQVCDGLAEAHRLGVIHRDLKPSNIMIDKAGTVRIMDFGIARSLKAKGITGTGVMIGTPEYMSPEQVEGREADQHSDIYSLGIILYEVLIGRIPFEGDTAFAIGLKHKSEEPEDPRKLNSHIPEDLSRLILKCLEKDMENRYQSAEELRSELIRIEEGIPTTERIIPKRKPITSREITVKFSLKKLFIPALAFVAIIAVIILTVFLIRKLPSGKPTLPTHKQLTFTGNAYNPAISPDGKFIAYVNYESPRKQKVMIQDMASNQALELLTVERCLNLQWMPDGSELSIWAKIDDSNQGTFILPRLGGTPRKLEATPFLAWAPDGFQFAGLWQGSKKMHIGDKSAGITKSIDLSLPFTWMRNIDWSPLGNLILLLTEGDEQQSSIWTITPDGNKWNKVIEDNVPISSALWSPHGDAIFYLRGREQAKEIWKIPVSSDTGKPSKSATAILSGMQAGEEFSITSDGRRLLYTREIHYSNLWLATVERTEKGQEVKTKQLTSGTLVYDYPEISPDGSLIAFSRGDGMTSNIYVMPIEGGNIKQITFFNSLNTSPVWSPDGKEIAFGSNEDGMPRVWKVSAQGGTPYQFAKSKLSQSRHLTWSPQPDILYHRPGNRNYHFLNPQTEEERPLIKDDSVGWVFTPQFSPNGKKVAVAWNRQPSRGLWVIFLEDSSEKLLKKERIFPLGWSDDGEWIHAVVIKSGKEEYIKIELKSGQVEELPVIAFKIDGESKHKIINEKPEIFVDDKTLSDVWLVENFDPEIK
jgi:serine/threonine protein kinase/Tol biopolymer transport system component